MLSDYLRWESHNADELTSFLSERTEALAKAGCQVTGAELSVGEGFVEIWFDADEAALRAYGYSDDEIAALRANS